jgi:membrane protein implicated in regulation of membrane protease activity
VFSASSVVSLVFLRKRFSRVFEGTVFIPGKADPEESGVGQGCDVVETVSGDKSGRVRFRGPTWTARSTGGTIPAGARARIVSLEGMTYVVESISGKEEA